MAALESLDIVPCPLTGEPPCLDRETGIVARTKARYTIEDNVHFLNPKL
jgi:hypothetical protein